MNEINRISNPNNINNQNFVINQNNLVNPSMNNNLQIADLYNNSHNNSVYQSQYNFVQSKGSNLWKYLLAGGLGLFTGLVLGSMMPYSYYFYYPVYYSYYYSPCWYNFGCYYW